MTPTCPKCGAALQVVGSGYSFACGTWIGSKDATTIDEGRDCTRSQRDALLRENAALRRAVKAAWNEGFDSGAGSGSEDREWNRSEAKRIHDSAPLSPPSPTKPTSPADAAISAK